MKTKRRKWISSTRWRRALTKPWKGFPAKTAKPAATKPPGSPMARAENRRARKAATARKKAARAKENRWPASPGKTVTVRKAEKKAVRPDARAAARATKDSRE